MGNMEIYRLELLLLLLIVLNQTFQTGIQGVIGFVSERLRFQFYHKTEQSCTTITGFSFFFYLYYGRVHLKMF